jgi:hypothetical protein
VKSAGSKSKNSPPANFARGEKPSRAVRIWRPAHFDVSPCGRRGRVHERIELQLAPRLLRILQVQLVFDELFMQLHRDLMPR